MVSSSCAGPLAMGRGMAVALLGVLVVSSLVDLSAAEVYKVGDSAGWTILGNPNYTAWASTKTFHAGDTLVFEYNKQFHNVLEVSRTDYRACNPSSPKSTYATGNDTITVKRKGHYFFICGIPGHCGLGQKVDIRIPKLASSASPSPSITPPSTPPASVPQKSHAASVHIGVAVFALTAVTTCLMRGMM